MSNTVIVFLPYSYPGGTAASLRVFNFVEGLVANEQKVHVLSLYHMASRRSKSKAYTPQNVIEHFVFGKKHTIQFANLRSYSSKVSKTFCDLVEMISSQEEVGLVYIYDGSSFLYFNAVSRLVRKHNLPLTFDITEQRDANYDLKTLIRSKDLNIKGKLSNMLLFPDYYFGKRIVYKRASFFVSISTTLVNFLSYYKKPVVVIPGFERFVEPGASVSHNTNVTFLYVGSLIERDAPDVLRLVIDEILLDNPTAVIKFVGRYGKTKDGEKYVEDLQRLHGRRIVSLGAVPEENMEEELTKADVMLLCRKDTEEERCAFPTRLAEYLAMEKPVLVSPVGDIPIYLEDGKDVCYIRVEPGNKLNSTSKMGIQRMLHEPAYREAVAKNGFVKGRKYFDAIFNAKRILDQLK